MFNAIISDTKSFKNSIEAIAALIDEGTLQIDKDGFKLRAMDPSQIAMVDFEMPAKAFDKYEVDNPENIGIDFSELSKITKRSKPEDKIEISLDKRLKLVFRSRTTREFNIAIIEVSSTPPKEPKIEFTAEAKVSADALKEALKDAELVSNHVALKLDGGVTINANGDTGSVTINFSPDDILSMDVQDEARAVFSTEQLNNLLKAAESPSAVILKLRSDSPLVLEYAIGDGKVLYFLAPRIESV